MPLVGCTKEHQCGQLKTVEPGNTLAPWVKCTFGNMITVGNESAPSLDNSAVIKSFNYGFSFGAECKIVIHDTMGSSLGEFLKNIMKELKDAGDKFISIQWGWTKSGCQTTPPESSSDIHYMLLTAIETNYIQGKFIHEITAQDTMTVALQGGIEKIYGEDGKNGITLKEALRKLLTEEPPPIVKTVDYCRVEKSGNVVCGVNFKDFPDGPKHSWKTNSANKLEVARKWVSGWLTDRDKIFELQYDTQDGGRVIFWEKPVFKCDEIYNQSNCIGTYIVNGGSDSPVIEFNPRIRWDFGSSNTVGGQHPTHTAQDNPNNKIQGIEECAELSRAGAKGTGQVASSPPTDTHTDIYGDKATSKAERPESIRKMMDGIHIMENGIMADMVIVGDPKFPKQSDGVIDGKTLAIAFVNPFHLMRSSGNCGDWLAKPPCNEWLSNKNWLVQKVNHRIENGTYTTSLSLRLTTSGYDSLVGSPLGNSPDGETI